MTEFAYVLDTEPVLAYLYDEPGHERVGELIDALYRGDQSAAIAEPIAAEIHYKVARFEGENDRPTDASLRIADRDIQALVRMGVVIHRVDWRDAATIKAYGGLSLADAYAVALAVQWDATLLVGADEDFDDLPVKVEIERIRDAPTEG